MAEVFPTFFIVGPTAVGKSSLALKLALKTSACIVNADSVQLYKDLEIGSAAPLLSEKKQVDHFLYQVVPSGEEWTASAYEEEAWKVISRELKTRPVVVVGGSGFYFRALEEGMGDSPNESDEVKELLLKRLEDKGAGALYEELQQVDPVAAKKIHENDHYRLLRALGYYLTYKSPFSEDQKLIKKRQWPGPLLKVGLTASQGVLKEKIFQRTTEMIAQGLIEEVQGLLGRGLREWRPLQSVGYLESVAFLDGKLKESELVGEITRKTLALAKKQKTWFKRDKGVTWFEMEKNDQALTWILSQLP